MATFNSQTSGGGGNVSCDGRLTNENTTWASTHDDTTASAGTNVTETTQGVRALMVSSSDWFIYRLVLTFDTSSLGAGASIASATLSLFDNSAVQPIQNADASACQIVSVSPANNNNLVAADYNKNNFGTTVFASINLASLSTNAFNVFSLNASGIAAINKTGVSAFGIRNSRDVSNSAPTGDNYNYILFADNGSNIPVLTVTLSGGATFNFRSLLGVGK